MVEVEVTVTLPPAITAGLVRNGRPAKTTSSSLFPPPSSLLRLPTTPPLSALCLLDSAGHEE